MALASPQELEGEMRALVRSQFPDSDSETVAYLAHLFATAPMPRWEEVIWSWGGLRKKACAAEDKRRVFGEKLDLSRRVGDGCLTLCTFYRGDDKPATAGKPMEPGLEIAGLGRAGYNVAGLYAAALGKEDSHVYPAISRHFLQIIARLGPSILRNYLGAVNPPQRIVVYTPHGEMLFRLRTSQN